MGNIPGWGNNTKKRKNLNIYLLGASTDFNYSALNDRKYNFGNTNLYNWIKDFSNKDITENNFYSLMNDIISKIQKSPEYNCILVFLNTIQENNDKDKVDLIRKCLSNFKKAYKPIVLLAFNKENKENATNEMDQKLSEDRKYFEIAFYNKNNYHDIEQKINMIYNYYFNIGDTLTNFIPIINDFTFQKDNYMNKEISSKYKATLNILVIGRPGCGKSTLINLLLNEKRARIGIGYSITKLYTQYIHNKYPITLTDTPGFENDEDLKKMEKFLSILNTFFKEGKSKFHLVLYLINTSNERTFIGTELNLINYIHENMKLPIFFVCTHSLTEEYSLEFQEAVRINLIQKFGEKTELTNKIFCCHLINERDGIYKRFGLDKILTGIKNHFSDEIERIKNFEKNFEDNLMKQEIKSIKDEPALNIMNSLEQSNSFGEYLEKICLNICDKYLTTISKNKDDLEITNKKLSNILGTLKNHLKFEYDVEKFKSYIDNKSEINCSTESIKEGCWPSNNDNDENNGNKIEEIKNFKKKVSEIKQFIIDNSKNDISNINEYMKEVIQNYEMAIKSLDKICDDINQN